MLVEQKLIDVAKLEQFAEATSIEYQFKWGWFLRTAQLQSSNLIWPQQTSKSLNSSASNLSQSFSYSWSYCPIYNYFEEAIRTLWNQICQICMSDYWWVWIMWCLLSGRSAKLSVFTINSWLPTVKWSLPAPAQYWQLNQLATDTEL